MCNCGFIFSRTGPDTDSNDKLRIGTIKEYGHVWKNELSKFVSEGYSLKEIAIRMEADTATIKKYAAELNLGVPWKVSTFPHSRERNVATERQEQLEKRKSYWKELQLLYPEKTKTELRMIAPDVYTYLYRRDSNWLRQNSPQSVRKSTSYQRVDWEKRDMEIRKEVEEAIVEWDINTEKLTRITVSAIGKRINKLWLLQKRSHKLPKTMELIYKVSEDTISFQKRRVEFVIKKLQRDGKPVTSWRIYREAGLRPTISDEVKTFVNLKVM